MFPLTREKIAGVWRSDGAAFLMAIQNKVTGQRLRGLTVG